MKPFFASSLTKDAIDALVKERVAWVLEVCRPEFIIVFGSAARGTMTAHSDIDLLVVMPTGNDAWRTSNAILGRKPPHDVPLDLLVYTRDDFETRGRVGGVCFVARTEGRVVYRATDEKEVS